jgi:hypothetical protein
MLVTQSVTYSLSELKGILNNLAADVSRDTVTGNLFLIANVGRREHAVAMLRQILDDNRLLTEIARRSYRHVNHFDKIVLIGDDDPSAYRLTLHLWCPPYSDAELEDELIHDHRFNFWSSVLAGTLVSENFEVAESGEVFRQYRYTPESRSTTFRDFYEFSGELKLAKASVRRRTAGEYYYLSAPSIHRIELPRTSITCTLVLRGPRLRHYSSVFNTRYPSNNTGFDNVMFTPSQVASRLSRLLDVLEENAAAPVVGADAYLVPTGR